MGTMNVKTGLVGREVTLDGFGEMVNLTATATITAVTPEEVFLRVTNPKTKKATEYPFDRVTGFPSADTKRTAGFRLRTAEITALREERIANEKGRPTAAPETKEDTKVETIVLEGYGKHSGKQQRAEVGDKTEKTIRLRVGNGAVKKAVEFRIADGMAVGSSPDEGYAIPKDALVALGGGNGAAPKAGKKPAATGGSPAVANGGSKPTPAPRTTTPTAGERGGMKGRTREAGKGEILLKVADRFHMAVSQMEDGFKPSKGDSAEVADAKKAWNDFDDKGWFYVLLTKAQAQVVHDRLSHLAEVKFPTMGIQGAGYKRGTTRLLDELRTKFGFKAPKVAATPPAGKPAAASTKAPAGKPMAAARRK